MAIASPVSIGVRVVCHSAPLKREAMEPLAIRNALPIAITETASSASGTIPTSPRMDRTIAPAPAIAPHSGAESRWLRSTQQVPVEKDLHRRPATVWLSRPAPKQAPRAHALRFEERQDEPAWPGYRCNTVRCVSSRKTATAVRGVPRRGSGQVHAAGRRDAAVDRRVTQTADRMPG